MDEEYPDDAGDGKTKNVHSAATIILLIPMLSQNSARTNARHAEVSIFLSSQMTFLIFLQGSSLV